MADFILLMHDDNDDDPSPGAWEAYFAMLHASGVFVGGSSIGEGRAYRRSGVAGPASDHLTGFIRIEASDLAAARAFLVGNPVFEGGGTVEIRELPRD
ncbi:MAG: hypothetical protein B7Y45_09700 [Sphingomonas sp. 28-66-16]|nr:MAG: hypothetical protein B7Y45_09700 [Sphingomonas sp. 28-66-16]